MSDRGSKIFVAYTKLEAIYLFLNKSLFSREQSKMVAGGKARE